MFVFEQGFAMNNKQKKEKTASVRILLRYAKGSTVLFILAFISIILAAFISMLDPLIIGFTVDTISSGGIPQTNSALQTVMNLFGGSAIFANNVWACALLLAGTVASSGIFMFLRGFFASLASERWIERIRNALYEHLLKVPYSYYGTTNSGELLQRCTSDIDTIRNFASAQLIDVSRAIALLVFTLAAMLSIDVRMTMISMPITPIVLAFSYIFFKKVQKAFAKSDEAEAAMTLVLQENLHGLRVVRSFARGAYEVNRFQKVNRTYTDETVKLIYLFGTYWGVSDWICLAQACVTLVAGALLSAQGLISVGVFVSFFAYVGKLFWPVRMLGRTLTDMGKALVSVKRVVEILTVSSEYQKNGTVKLEKVNGKIEFESITFGYTNEHTVLKQVSFTVEPGETVALLGKTGTGKSTLMALLTRLLELQEGSIKLDGIDIRQFDKQWLRQTIGLVLQESFLYSLSMRENVSIGLPKMSDESLEQLAACSGLTEVIADFTDGWDTVIGEQGVTLSGGQRQRTALARMLARDPAILVLDDSMSALDTETDATIQSALKKEKKRTCIIISHRLTTLARADKIVVLEDGKVADIGTHQELIAREGLYKRIWEIQSGLERDFGIIDSSEAV